MDFTEMTRRPLLKSGIEFRVLDDLSSVAVDPESGQAHALTPVATAIFERCDGTMTVGEIMSELVEIFDCTFEQVNRDALLFLNNLANQGLISW